MANLISTNIKTLNNCESMVAMKMNVPVISPLDVVWPGPMKYWASSAGTSLLYCRSTKDIEGIDFLAICPAGKNFIIVEVKNSDKGIAASGISKIIKKCILFTPKIVSIVANKISSSLKTESKPLEENGYTLAKIVPSPVSQTEESIKNYDPPILKACGPLNSQKMYIILDISKFGVSYSGLV